jgi:hypothetical protein
VLDVDDPEPGARKVSEDAERQVSERREAEGELADALLPLKDLRVINDPALPEEEAILPVFELVDPGGEYVE